MVQFGRGWDRRRRRVRQGGGAGRGFSLPRKRVSLPRKRVILARKRVILPRKRVIVELAWGDFGLISQRVLGASSRRLAGSRRRRVDQRRRLACCGTGVLIGGADGDEHRQSDDRGGKALIIGAGRKLRRGISGHDQLMPCAGLTRRRQT